MKTEKYPSTLTKKRVSALIRKSKKLKDSKTHTYFIVENIELGKRKQAWRSDPEGAEVLETDA
ncbi:MAG: hypothetical protein ABSE48_18940 [Verrucomicrobiota bacterium]